MTTITKYVSAAALSVALALPLAAPVSAGEKSASAESAPIVVQSRAAMKEWKAETNKGLNRALTQIALPRKVLPNDAIVQVAFTLDANGQPTNMQVLDGKGNWAARKTAERAIRRIDTFDEVPVANPQSARFLANIIFAGTADARDRLASELRESERERIAAAQGRDDYIRLGG